MGPSLLAIFGLTSLLLMTWQLLWLNTVVFRITRDEVERADEPAALPATADESDNPYQSPTYEAEPPPKRPLWQRFLRRLADRLILFVLATIGGIVCACFIIAAGLLVRWLRGQ